MNTKGKNKITWDSGSVAQVEKDMDDGYILKAAEIPFFKKTVGLRKSGLPFRLSEEEVNEYMKCKVNIFHFIESYCFVKSEDGEFHKITLRDYQSDIIELFNNNKLNILMASRQVGKCVDFLTDVEIYDTKKESEYKLPLFKLYFKNKSKNIYDYIKYGIYSIIYKLS